MVSSTSTKYQVVSSTKYQMVSSTPEVDLVGLMASVIECCKFGLKYRYQVPSIKWSQVPGTKWIIWLGLKALLNVPGLFSSTKYQVPSRFKWFEGLPYWMLQPVQCRVNEFNTKSNATASLFQSNIGNNRQKSKRNRRKAKSQKHDKASE